MRILFRTSGGPITKKELGYGHVYRCINLASCLRPNDMYFLIEDYGGVKEILKERGFKNVLSLRKKGDVNSDIKETVNHIIKKHIDILIVDWYGFKIKYLREVSKFTKIVVICDLRKFDYRADLVINGFIGFENAIVKNSYWSKCLLGPSYQILSKKFAKRAFGKKKYKLLATFGGFDDNNIIEMFLSSLTKYTKKIKTKVILGPATIKSKKIKLFEKKYQKHIKIIQSTKDMHKEISRAEIGICSGGITTYEFAAMRVPFAIVSQVKHQLITAREWERKGHAINLGLISSKTSNRIDKFLKNIVEKRLPQINKSNIIDGLGAQRVAKEILGIKLDS